MKSAVLFVIFRRPATTQRVFDAIREARPPKLYIAADGPRPERADDLERCNEVRAIVEDIDWPCDVVRMYQASNVGLRENISSAVDTFLEAEGEGIILEDDTLPSPDFFEFCDEMLARYRNDDRVGVVSGYNPVLPSPFAADRHDFSQLPMIWGWATWRGSWLGHRSTFESWPGDATNFPSSILTCFNAPKKWIDNLEQVRSGDLSSVWSYPFFYHCWANEVLSVIPGRSLVINIGHGADATHTNASTPPRHVRELKLTEGALPSEPRDQIETSTRLDAMILADYYKLGRKAALRQMLVPLRTAVWRLLPGRG